LVWRVSKTKLLAVASVLLVSFGSTLAAGDSHEPGALPPVEDCAPKPYTELSLYSTCLMPLDGAVWDCYYAEAVPGLNQRLCFYPIPTDLLAGAPARLDVRVNLGALKGLAVRALEIPEVQQLVGTGRAVIDVNVGSDSGRFIVEGNQIVDAFYTAPPRLCTPFDVSTLLAALPPETAGQWNARAATALGVCATTIVPDPSQCWAAARVPGTRSFLCWWGVQGSGGPDFRFDVSPDVLRAVLNSDDPAGVARLALSRGNIVIWSDDLLKRAALRAALESVLGNAPDLRPAPTQPGAGISILGREFQVSYFPRDGVMTPCARDGQGTWYWLNEFGVPNGFVGTSTVEAMKRFLAAHGTAPTEEQLLEDLYLNWVQGGTVEIDGVLVPIEYVFVPGSPFSLLPVAKLPDGTYARLNGDGSVQATLTAQESEAMARRVAAANEISRHVDFNKQPGTLAQDLKFLQYAIERNPATPQIEDLLRKLGTPSAPVPEAIAGLFPPESPRLPLGSNFVHRNVTAAVASGDAYVLGMATHHLLWNELIRFGAIEPSGEVDA
jgi:peptidoglycan hydrolase-like protein with peptidoglycan-binding domain